MTEEQVRAFRFRGAGIPAHMIDAVLRYFNDHVEPGGFLCALLTNDLMESFMRADDRNLVALPTWAAFLYNEAPIDACGSPEKVKAWIADRVA